MQVTFFCHTVITEEVWNYNIFKQYNTFWKYQCSGYGWRRWCHGEYITSHLFQILSL